jgi:hypothetical protein
MPAPARMPKPTMNMGRLVKRLARIKPAPVRRPPRLATMRGPNLSWSFPAGTMVKANTRQAMV